MASPPPYVRYCKNHDGHCILKDDMAEILEKMNDADVIAMASPVYFYSIDAQMKALIDRTVAQWLKIRDKTFYYIMTAAEDSAWVMDCTLECMRGLAKCLKGSSEGGVIYGKGVYAPGEIREKPAMREAYEMGKSVYNCDDAAAPDDIGRHGGVRSGHQR